MPSSMARRHHRLRPLRTIDCVLRSVPRLFTAWDGCLRLRNRNDNGERLVLRFRAGSEAFLHEMVG